LLFIVDAVKDLKNKIVIKETFISIHVYIHGGNYMSAMTETFTGITFTRPEDEVLGRIGINICSLLKILYLFPEIVSIVRSVLLNFY